MERQSSQHGDLCPHVQRSYEVGQGMGRLTNHIRKMKEAMERRILDYSFEICLDLELSFDIPKHA